MKHNPWAVEDITAFLFYNCPECDVKVKDPDAFRGHALQVHERAKGALNAGAFDISYHSESELTHFAEKHHNHKEVKKEDSFVDDFTIQSEESSSETSESNSDDYEYDSTPERKTSPKKRIKREHHETIEVKPDIYDGEPSVKKSRPAYHSQCY